ncbi:hypothetical protein E8F12_12910 [Pseudomonas sp. BN102]|nr:hypothetical protein [Pseudomonas sp. BN102]
MFLRQRSIAYRAATGFAIITLTLVCLGLFARNRMAAMNQASTRISGLWLPSVLVSGQMGMLLSEFRQSEMNHVLARDLATMQALVQQMDAILADLARMQDDYEPLLVNSLPQTGIPNRKKGAIMGALLFHGAVMPPRGRSLPCPVGRRAAATWAPGAGNPRIPDVPAAGRAPRAEWPPVCRCWSARQTAGAWRSWSG